RKAKTRQRLGSVFLAPNKKVFVSRSDPPAFSRPGDQSASKSSAKACWPCLSCWLLQLARRLGLHLARERRGKVRANNRPRLPCKIFSKSSSSPGSAASMARIGCRLRQASNADTELPAAGRAKDKNLIRGRRGASEVYS